MADTKLSLEDILDEYKTDPNDGSTAHVGRVDAQKIINSTLPDPVKTSAKIPKAVSHEKNELFDSDEVKGIPANEITPEELSRKTAAVADEDGIRGRINEGKGSGEKKAEEELVRQRKNKKNLFKRKAVGRVHVYSARGEKEKTQQR